MSAERTPSKTKRLRPHLSPPAFVFGLGLLLACGGPPQALEARSEAGGAVSEAERGTEGGTWFEIAGSRERVVKDARPGIVRMAELPLFEDDHPGLLLAIREQGETRAKSARIEIFPLPDPLVPGEYPLVAGSSAGDGAVGASVILPKENEKVFLPMAIYGEEVSGMLILLESPLGTVRGRFEIRARLDAGAEEPALIAVGAFEGARIPSQP